MMADQESTKNSSDEVSGRVSRHMCVPCEKQNRQTPADVFCTDCRLYQCVECCEVHNSFDVMSKHNIKDVIKPVPLERVDMKGLDVCGEHKKPLEFFCVDEQTLCCSVCAVLKHKSCKHVNVISKEASEADLQPDTIKQALSEEQRRASKLLEFIEESTSDSFEKSLLEPLLSLIHEVRESFTKKCVDMETKVSDLVRQAQSTRKDKIMDNLEINKGILKQTEDYNQILTSVFEHGTPEQKFIAFHAIEKNVGRYKTILNNQHATLYKLECTVECSEFVNDLLQTSKDVASVVMNKVNFDPDVPAVERPRQLRLITSLCLKRDEGDSKEPLYSGMDFFPDGRLAVIDNKNMKMKIHGIRLHTLGVFKFSDYRHDVCVVSEDKVAVTSGGDYVIEFLHVSKDSVITLKRTVDTTTQNFTICMMNATTFLVSTINGKRPLRKITVTGEENEFTNLSGKDYDIGDSRCTYIRDEDKLVLTDKCAHAVYLYDNGDVPTMRVVTDDKIKQPTSVCVGPEDCLYVCSSDTNSIVQVSSVGKVVASHELDIVYPSAVSISKDRKILAVSNSEKGKRKLQRFEVL